MTQRNLGSLLSYIFTLFIFLTTFLFSTGISFAEEKKLTVAGAADLTFAMKEIAAEFEKDTGAKVVLSMGSTGMLAKQIREGAPFDVFFAADQKFIEGIKNDGIILPESVEVYAQGRIVLAVNKNSGLKATDLKDLLNPEIKRIAIANPEHAPYGKAAMEALQKLGIWEAVKTKLVYGENIRQTLQYIQTGNAPVGVVALSVVNVPEITYTPIEQTLHNPIIQATGVVHSSKMPDLAKDFIKFVNGKKGRPIMKKYGFLMPGEF